ncbi:MAG: serine/threonine-protein kinase [Planctomycetota bacterium]
MSSSEPSSDPARLVHSLVQSGQLTPEQAELYLAETRRAPPGSAPPPPPSGSSSAVGSVAPSGFGAVAPSGFGAVAPSGYDSVPLAHAQALTRGPLAWTQGSVVGAYRLEARLGRGGAGEVWRVTHLPTGAPRALKTLLPFAEPMERARFLREAQALARLDGHPNVIRIHDVGQHDQRVFLVMDLAQPEDLHQRLKAGPLPPADARRLLADLAAGLAHVHALGLMHRDLKPQNVLFADDGRPLLSDFGLVRGAARTSLSVTGEILGTPAYMAPEQAIGEPVDERTDVYGLGAVLYHVLTGRAPFQGRTPITVLQQVMTQAPPAPSSLVPDVDKDLERICLKALAKRQDDRFPSARALRAALLGAAPAPRAARRGALAGLGLAGGLTLLLVAWVFARAAPPPQVPAPVADTPEPTAAVVDSGEQELDLPTLLELLRAHEPQTETDFETLGLETVKGGSIATKSLRSGVSAKKRSFERGATSWLDVAQAYLRLAEAEPSAWREFAEFVQGSNPLRDLGLPQPYDLDRLAAALLREGHARGDIPCAYVLGNRYEAGEGSLPRDRKQALRLYCAGIAEASSDHVDKSVRLWRELGADADAIPPVVRLALCEAALRLEWGRPPSDVQTFLVLQRAELRQQVGAALLEGKEVLSEAAWDALRRDPVWAKAAMVAPEGSSGFLHCIGQEFSQRLTNLGSPARGDLASAMIHDSQREALARCALACLLRAGTQHAWSDVAHLGTRPAVPEIQGYHRLAVRTLALREAGDDPTAIALLAFDLTREAEVFPAGWRLVAATLPTDEFPRGFRGPSDKLKLAYAAGALCRAEPARCPYPLEVVRRYLDEAIAGSDGPVDLLQSCRTLAGDLERRTD